MSCTNRNSRKAASHRWSPGLVWIRHRSVFILMQSDDVRPHGQAQPHAAVYLNIRCGCSRVRCRCWIKEKDGRLWTRSDRWVGRTCVLVLSMPSVFLSESFTTAVLRASKNGGFCTALPVLRWRKNGSSTTDQLSSPRAAHRSSAGGITYLLVRPALLTAIPKSRPPQPCGSRALHFSTTARHGCQPCAQASLPLSSQRFGRPLISSTAAGFSSEERSPMS